MYHTDGIWAVNSKYGFLLNYRVSQKRDAGEYVWKGKDYLWLVVGS